MQAWLYEPGRVLDGPRKGGFILPPPSLKPRISPPRGSRGSFGPRSNQAGPSTCNTFEHRHGLEINNSRTRSVPQPLPARRISSSASFGNVDAVLATRSNPDPTNLHLYQQRPGHSSPFAESARELSNSSGTLHTTPELSSSSRNSSLSAIPDFYAPDRSSSYGTFQSIPGSPYHHHQPSVSSASSVYTPSSPRNMAVSSPTIQDAASDDGSKVIIREVKAGVTAEDLSRLIDQKMQYVQHEPPKRCEGNKWSVKFLNEEAAVEGKARLHNSDFAGQKLSVHLSNRGPRRRIYSVGSSTSTTSSTVSSRPTIVDGSVIG